MVYVREECELEWGLESTCKSVGRFECIPVPVPDAKNESIQKPTNKEKEHEVDEEDERCLRRESMLYTDALPQAPRQHVEPPEGKRGKDHILCVNTASETFGTSHAISLMHRKPYSRCLHDDRASPLKMRRHYRQG